MNCLFLEWKMSVENQTKTRVWSELSLCRETSTKIPFKNYIFGLFPRSWITATL